MSSTLWFAGDALVNDRREFWGKDTIRAWLDREDHRRQGDNQPHRHRITAR
jgi:hypothetical protein